MVLPLGQRRMLAEALFRQGLGLGEVQRRLSEMGQGVRRLTLSQWRNELLGRLRTGADVNRIPLDKRPDVRRLPPPPGFQVNKLRVRVDVVYQVPGVAGYGIAGVTIGYDDIPTRRQIISDAINTAMKGIRQYDAEVVAVNITEATYKE